MRWIRHGRAVVMGLVGLVPLTATADEDQVDLKDVPASVREAADKTVPQAKWRQATREKDEESILYHLNGADAKGREVNLTLTAEVRVESFETVLSVTDLPANVVEVLRTLPQVKWTDASETVEDGKTTYEVSGTDLEDHESIAFFRPDGHVTIHADRELSEVPAIVSDALKASRPTFQSENVRSVTENGKLVAYLFVRTQGPDDEEIAVKVSADGKTVTDGDDDGDDDD